MPTRSASNRRATRLFLHGPTAAFPTCKSHRPPEKWLASLKKMPNENHLRSMTKDFARQTADIARSLRIEQTKKEWPFTLPNKSEKSA